MANQYGRWFVHNDPQDFRKSLGAYNRPFKERYERPPEYTPSVEAYKHYPAIKKITAEEEERQNVETQNSSQSNGAQTKQARSTKGIRSASNAARNVVGRVVAATAGTAVAVVGYQAVEAERLAAESMPETVVEQVVANTEWTWSEDNQTVTVAFYDAEGNVIEDLVATVTIATEEATCTQAGSKTYTATAQKDGKDYSDLHTETLAPTGHSYDSGKIIALEGGAIGLERECQNCHEKFTVTVSAEEDE